MKKLSNNEKNLIIKSIKGGKSLNQINKLTGKSKTTIYYYMRKIKGKQLKEIKIN